MWIKKKIHPFLYLVHCYLSLTQFQKILVDIYLVKCLELINVKLFTQFDNGLLNIRVSNVTELNSTFAKM